MVLPVCDHYSGVEVRMRKSLQLQAEMTQEFGACVFDVTLDCEDGAPVGGEIEHAHLVREIAANAAPEARVAVRVHPVDHPSFGSDINLIVGSAHPKLRHVMVPKVETVADVDAAANALNQVGASSLPLHVLIESPAAVHRAFEIAAHPRVQSLSFGLMDFVSAHGGAIPSSGMGVLGQFTHPLVVRAKLEIASACHAHGKVPSHCVVTEFSDLEAIKLAATKASRELGYTRNGEFSIGSGGQLVTSQGFPVLSDGGALQLDNTVPGPVAIAADGTVSKGGTARGKLRVVSFNAPEQLTASGGGIWKATNPGLQKTDVTDASLRSGGVEGSNTSAVAEMVGMIHAMRMYEANQKVIQMQDDRMGRAITDLGGTGS